MWIVLLLVILLLIYWRSWRGSVVENLVSPCSERKHRFSHYYDLYKRDGHKYPFDFYSLYGYDDYYPVARYHHDYEYPASKYPQKPWKDGGNEQYRGDDHIRLASLDYNGLPSYFFRHYYQWPKGFSAAEKQIRQKGERKSP